MIILERGEINMRNNKFVSITCILVCLIIAFSFIFIVMEEDHFCIGEECHICLELKTCKSLLRSISYASMCIFLFYHIHTCADNMYMNSKVSNKATPLISLKVQQAKVLADLTSVMI